MSRLFDKVKRRKKPRPTVEEAGTGEGRAKESRDDNADEAGAGPGARRLDSWKRIARYLDRDVRTVQRWEASEDLPVHRLEHGRQGTVFAYADELDAWRREHERRGNGSRAGPKRRVLVTGLVVVLALIGAAVAYRIVTASDASALAGDRPMLAVLPFQSLGATPGHGYFAAGLTEDLITNLGQINPGELGVIARTSVMRYADTRKSIAQIGRELNVDYILEGSVRRVGERLRVTAQLIDADDQTHVWANSYDRKLQDVLKLQAELANQVAGAIQVELGPIRAEAGTAPTVDPKAYQLLARGRHQLYRWMPGGFLEGRRYLRRAVELDPDLASAWSWLAMANLGIATYEVEPREEAYDRAVKAARRALALDPRQGLALFVLAYKTYRYDWNWDRAEELFRCAIEASPNSPWTHWGYSGLLTILGRHDEAIAQARLALRLDPASIYMQYFGLRYALLYARRYDETLAACEAMREALPERPGAFYGCLLAVYKRTAQYQKAIEMHAKLHELGAAAGYTNMGEVDDADIAALRRAWREHGAAGYWRWVKAMRDRPGDFNAVDRAIPRVQLGEFDEAMAMLEEGFRQRGFSMPIIKVEPLLDPLRDDPRFRDLLRRMHLQGD
ncbi:MAG: tetratricopeptide repeat protein [Gammaproteobacteria bacterium]|nr:tetratricopeptide repeat protein [Gammaproteobacteria bacterium]